MNEQTELAEGIAYLVGLQIKKDDVNRELSDAVAAISDRTEIPIKVLNSFSRALAKGKMDSLNHEIDAFISLAGFYKEGKISA